MNEAQNACRMTAAHYGSTLTRAIDFSCTGYDEKEKRLIKDGAKGCLEDIASSRSNVGLNIKGPYSLTLDSNDTHFTLTFTGENQTEKVVSIPLGELQGFIRSYRHHMAQFAKTPSHRPQASVRQALEEARYQTHQLAAYKILDIIHPQGVSISRDLGEAIFKALCCTWYDPERKNPYPEAILAENRFNSPLGRV